LKSLEAALEDGDHIYGVIMGSGINQDGKTNGITAPSAPSQTALECEVYDRYGISPETISYVETHGTGTKLGDPIEIDALTDAFRKYTTETQYCAVGSVKTNIGHTLAAAGVAGLIKILLCMKYKTLVPSIHYEKQNEHINFKDGPFYVNTEAKPWKTRGGIPRIASISSFGFSGTNAHVVIRESIEQPVCSVREWEKAGYVIPISAKTDTALRQKLKDIREWLAHEGQVHRMEDIAYTLSVGRSHYPIRLAFTVANHEELRQKIEAILEDRDIKIHCVDTQFEKREKALEQVGEVEVFIKELRRNDVEKEAYMQQLMTLVELYLKGDYLPWDKLYKDQGCQRISLPSYP
ncbi:polyketide synthase, partial [Bacillus wiedmannii]|uniref:KS-MAT linker domain-containing protein n=2 Tax=Bacillus wiedmannii TaxID=1890302 RepID=UPI000BFAB10B